eukprot:179927-Rhodomonas_salina.1
MDGQRKWYKKSQLRLVRDETQVSYHSTNLLRHDGLPCYGAAAPRQVPRGPGVRARAARATRGGAR